MGYQSWENPKHSASLWLVATTTNKIDDFNRVAVADERCREGGAPDDHQIVLDGDTPWIDVQPLEELLHRQRLVQIVGIPVERDAHGRGFSWIVLYGNHEGRCAAGAKLTKNIKSS